MAKIRHLAIVTSDQQKLAHFYKTAFGMKEVRGIGPALYLSDGYMNLALIDVNSPGLNLKEGLYHFGIEVDGIEPLREALTAMGTASKLEPRPKNRDAEFRVHDPDGNPIDISRPNHPWPI